MIRNFKLSRKFWLKEFFSDAEWNKFQTFTPTKQCYIVSRISLLIPVLQNVRDHFKRQTNVHDGVRYDDDKFHGMFVAADISVAGVPHNRVQEFLKTKHPEIAIGSYDGHSHCDMRHIISLKWYNRSPARWHGISR